MSWTHPALETLAALPRWGYRADGPTATEPAALAALALICHDRLEAARRPLDELAKIQQDDGAVGVTPTDATPNWTTSLCLLAWRHHDAATNPAERRYAAQSERAVEWLLDAKGDPMPRSAVLGHDSTIIGWPWVLGTHSWLEPTAWAVLALGSADEADHPRTREGVRMLIDRLLPTGGANYGNTFVLGQRLRPQVEPTGLALLALHGEVDRSGRIDAACDYLLAALKPETPPISLSYGVLGLAAHDRLPDQFATLVEAAYARAPESLSPLALALLLLAAPGGASPLFATQNLQSRSA